MPDRHGIRLFARPCPMATTILSLVRYRIPVIAHVDKASAANRGPLSRLSSSANSSPANQRLTTAPRSSSSNNVGAFRTRLRPCRTPTCESLSRRLRARLSEIAKLYHFWHIMLKTMLKDIDFAKGSWILVMHISKLILNLYKILSIYNFKYRVI